MKVLIDARMAYPPNHGIARYTMNLIRGLRGHVDLHLLVQSQEALTFFKSETPWVSQYVRSRIPFANPLDTFELSFVVPKIYDVVHFPSFSVPLRLPKKCIITLHDLIHLKEGASPFHKIYYATVVKNAVKKSKHVIAVSQWTKNEIVSAFGTNPDKVTVIPNGLESQWFAETPAMPTENKFREARNLRAPYICCVSNTKAHKNLPTLLKACELLWEKGAKFELALAVGKENFPSELSLQPLFRPRVKMLHRLTEQELMALYRHAQLTVSPSQYEGYSLPVAESLAMKTPVVISQASAHKEFTGPGIFFFAPYDSATDLAKIIAKNVESKSDFSFTSKNILTQQEMADQTLQLYRRVQSGI